MASTIQVRVDEDLKLKSDSLFKSLGTDTTSAIRIFLTQAVAADGFPFEIKRVPLKESNPFAALSEEDLLLKLERAREHGQQGRVKDTDEIIADMRSRYGL